MSGRSLEFDELAEMLITDDNLDMCYEEPNLYQSDEDLMAVRTDLGGNHTSLDPQALDDYLLSYRSNLHSIQSYDAVTSNEPQLEELVWDEEMNNNLKACVSSDLSSEHYPLVYDNFCFSSSSSPLLHPSFGVSAETSYPNGLPMVPSRASRMTSGFFGQSDQSRGFPPFNSAAQVVPAFQVESSRIKRHDDSRVTDTHLPVAQRVHSGIKPHTCTSTIKDYDAPNVVPDRVRLKPVSILLRKPKTMFLAFDKLNDIYSLYSRDDNVVVSAPTGAGKTVLLELAILRLFSSQHSEEAIAVYLAPTKSLCSERTQEWKSRFARFGWTVCELTGDSVGYAGTWKDVTSARIVVTTPEKWDSMTRQWHAHNKLFKKVQLVCLDEVHIVGLDTRGAVLEAVVSRIKILGSHTRFIALSATCPNIEDLAQWLGRDTEERRQGAEEKYPALIYRCGEEFRPCKLEKYVYGYTRKSNDFQFQNSITSKVYELIERHAAGKQVLVFCNTRKHCIQTAEAIVKEYQRVASSTKRGNTWPRPTKSAVIAHDKRLSNLLESSVAFHHAGLDIQDRRLVEQRFIDRTINIVCSTSTLAMGVNLPASMVIVKGTTQYRDGKSVEYSDAEVLQMIGRAGRPQFDTKGIACIMTNFEQVNHYESLINSQTVLESCLHKSLTEHINSEITLHTITDIPSALAWLRSTFLYIRIVKNPRYYALATKTNTTAEARLEEICIEAVNELIQGGVVGQAGDALTPTVYGDMMSKFYLQHSTFIALSSVPQKAGIRTLLEALSSCAEFRDIRFRQGERSLYAKHNRLVRYPVAKVATEAHKVMILLQLNLQGISLAELKTENSNPGTDSLMLWKHATRIIKCMLDLFVEKRDSATKAALELLRSVNAKAWDSSPAILRQLDGIGEKSIKLLSERNIMSIRDVATADASRLELILNRNPPFGRKLVAQALSIPSFTLKLSIIGEKVIDSGIVVTFDIAVGLEEDQSKAAIRKSQARYWACILVITSDEEFIDFRRIPVDKLRGCLRHLQLSIILVKPSQRVIVRISSENVAGSETVGSIKPMTYASQYPIPEISTDPEEWVYDEEIDGRFESDRSPNSPSPKPECTTSKDQRRPRSSSALLSQEFAKKVPGSKASAIISDTTPARLLANNRYECNHRCHDKASCLHLCCRDGTAKPPRSSEPAKRAHKNTVSPKGREAAKRKPSQLKKSNELHKKDGRLFDEIRSNETLPSVRNIMQNFHKQMSSNTAQQPFYAKQKSPLENGRNMIGNVTTKIEGNHNGSYGDSSQEIDELDECDRSSLEIIGYDVEGQLAIPREQSTQTDIRLHSGKRPRNSPSSVEESISSVESVHKSVQRQKSRKELKTQDSTSNVSSISPNKNNDEEEDNDFDDWLTNQTNLNINAPIA